MGADQLSLTDLARRGALITIGSRGARTLVSFGGSVILARLLNPEIFGIFAAALVVVASCELLLDFGLSAAGLQASRLSSEQRNALSLINAGVAVIVTLLLVALAPAVGALYGGREEVAAILPLMAAPLAIAGIAVQSRVDLLRSGRYGALAWTDFTSIIASTAVAIAAAIQGAGLYSLVLLWVIGSVMRSVATLFFARWRPRWPRGVSGLRELLTVGTRVAAIQALNQGSQSADTILIGRYAGVEALGLYSRAYQLLLVPIQQITTPLGAVVIPLLSRIREEPDRAQRALVLATSLLAYSAVPCVLLLGAAAEPVVLVLYGEEWREAALLLSVLSLAGAARAFSSLIGWASTALGTTSRQLSFTLFSQIVTVSALAVGARWGALGVALAYSATSMIAVPTGLWWTLRTTSIRLRPLVAAASRPLVWWAVIAVAVNAVIENTAASTPWAVMTFGACAALAGMTLAFLTSGGIRTDIQHIVGFLRASR